LTRLAKEALEIFKVFASGTLPDEVTLFNACGNGTA
jgi:hypothetical protein